MTDEQNDEKKPCVTEEPEQQAPALPPRWRPASEPTCCGSGCDDCPF